MAWEISHERGVSWFRGGAWVEREDGEFSLNTPPPSQKLTQKFFTISVLQYIPDTEEYDDRSGIDLL